jgi:formate dehydrogenase major subunit
MQWPIYHEDTPILHLLDFRTDDGLGNFVYYKWQMRGMIEDIIKDNLDSSSLNGWYLTTGRTLAHYNNAAQTKRSKKLETKYDEDILLAPPSAKEIFGDFVILRNEFGESEALKVKYSDTIKEHTLFTTFHHAKSKINALFGDESDNFVLTAKFKSVKVDVIPAGGEIVGS